jgi:hypothetical protein
VGAFEFDGLLESGDRIDGAFEDVDLGIAVDIAGGLIDFEELGLPLKIVQQEDAGVFWDAETGNNFGEGGFDAVQFFIEFDGLGGWSGTILCIFFCGGPVDQRVGEFFPVFALGAEIADSVAFDFVFGDELVGAIFKDEAAGRRFLGGGER